MNENLKKFISMLSEQQKKQTQSPPEIVEQPVVIQPQLTETIQPSIPQRVQPTLSGPEMLAARLSKQTMVEEQQADPLVPLNQKFVTLKEMNDHYGLFLQRIQQQLASLGGGGEVKFARLDDVDASTAGTNKYLIYNPSTKKFQFSQVGVADGISLDGSGNITLAVATETTLGGIKLGPGVELNGLDQIVINSEGLDFSFGDFFGYTAIGPSGNTAAFLSSINDNEDIVIASNGNGQVDIIGRFSIFTTASANNLVAAEPVFNVNDDGDIKATTLNIVNMADLEFQAPLNVSINEQGLTKVPAVISGAVAQFTGRDNRQPGVVVDAYGLDAGQGGITGGKLVFRTGRGTNANTASVLLNDRLGHIAAAGWASNGYAGVDSASIVIVANEDFSATARGGRIELRAVPNGTVVPQMVATIDSSGIIMSSNTIIGNLTALEFDTTHVDDHIAEGTLCWSSQDRTLNLHHQNNVRQQVGQETYTLGLNGTGSVIPNATVVRIDGAQSDGGIVRLKVAPFQADGVYPTVNGLGVTTESIANNTVGFVTVWGIVRDLDTTGSTVSETWAEGDILYVSPTTAGAFTKVKPTAPNNVLPIATVLKVDNTAGEIFVRPVIDQKYNYGTFSSTVDILAANTDYGYAVEYDTSDISNGATLGTPASRVYVDQSGLFQISFIAQVTATSNKGLFYSWFRKNGIDIPNSMHRTTITNGDSFTINTSLQMSLDANNYVEAVWARSAAGIIIDSTEATAFGPSTTGATLRIEQIQL